MEPVESRTSGDRLLALDFLRGLAVVLMALDHASLFLNEARWMPSTVPGAEEVLPVGQFLTRWLAYSCAPSFLVLVGVVLALSVERRRRAGDSEGAIDRHLVARGLFIAALDPLIVSLGAERVWLQVLWVIGLSLVLMAALRRLPAPALLALAVGWWVGGEAVTRAALGPDLAAEGWLQGLLLAPWSGRHVAFFYPLVPWLAVVLLGYALGRRLVARRDRGLPGLAPKRLALGGAALLVVHALLRALGGYGNMGVGSGDPPALGWLLVNKEIPSATFLALELGLTALALAAIELLVRAGRIGARNPLTVFGRAALCFYLAHWVLLRGAAKLLDLQKELSLGAVWLATLAVLVVLLPASRAFLALKRRHPSHLFLRYL